MFLINNFFRGYDFWFAVKKNPPPMPILSEMVSNMLIIISEASALPAIR